MKKNGVALIIVFFVILLGVVFGVLYLKYGNVELEKEQPNVDLKYGIVSTAVIEGDNLYPYKINDNYYIVEKDGNCGVVDSDNKEVIPFIYNNCDFSNDLLMAENDNKKYVLNMNNEVIFESEDNITYAKDIGSETPYYFAIYDNKTDIYDGEFNLLKTIDEETYISIIGNYIVADDYIYQFDSDEKIKYGSAYFNSNYLIFDIRKKTGYEVYDVKKKELVHYAKKEENEYAMTFIDGDKKLILDYDGNVLEDGEKMKVLDKYYFDYSVCKSGFSLVDLEGNRLTNSCYSSYDSEIMEYGNLLLFSYDDGIHDLVKSSGEIITFETSEAYVSGKNIRVWDNEKQENSFYDINGNKQEEVCKDGVNYIGDDRYICYSSATKYIVDEERNIINGPYNSVFCNEDNVCVVQDNNGRYGVVFNGEEIIEPSYYEGNIDGDIVVLKGYTKNYVLKFGKSEKLLTKDELLFENKMEYQEVNVDEVIKEYSLEEKETIIKENEELFKKYSSIILNNDDLGKYKSEILNMFDVLIDQKNNLDEEYFFLGLSNLSIKEVDQIPISYAVGVYYDQTKSIELKEKSYSVLTHELMHFFDYNVNNSFDKNIYVCGDNYYSKYDLIELSLEEQSKCNLFTSESANNFIVEAGAEVNSFRYSDAMMDSYTNATVVYNALVYLFGEEFMESVFFSKDGDYQLFEKITKYISPDEYVKFMDAAKYFTLNDVVEYDRNDPKVVAETLIKLYEETIGGNWYDDKEFLLMINSVVNMYDMDIYDFETEYLKDISSVITELINQVDMSYSMRISVSGIVTKDNKTYLNIPVWKDSEAGYLKLIYDFENEKVLEFIDFYSEN